MRGFEVQGFGQCPCELHLCALQVLAIHEQVHVLVELRMNGFEHFRVPVADVAYADT
ncbi:hypothetical protein D3C86_2235600 [compost metagenome]